MTEYLRPVPAAFQSDRDMALFLEQIRTRLRDATTGTPGLVRRTAPRADSAAAVTAADAGTTYTAAEQALINEIKANHNQLQADFNDLLAKLKVAGVMEP